MLNQKKNPTAAEIDNFSDNEMKEMFRESLLDSNPELKQNPNLLQQQVDFLFDRSVNFGNEILTESEISDQAYKLGLVDNNFIVRKVNSQYDFSQQ